MAIKSQFPVVKPSLNLDFANTRQLDPRIQYTRNSVATYYGPDGLLKTAQVNEPRFDHNPVTRQCEGLLIEEGRTNFYTYSEAFNETVWNKTNANVTPNSQLAPDGTTTASFISEDTSSGHHFIGRTINNVIPQTGDQTLSMYVKAGTRTVFRFENVKGAGRRVSVNLITGVVESAVTIGSGGLDSFSERVVSVGNGWWRILSSIKPTVGSITSGLTISVMQGTGVTEYTGDGTSGFLLWGVQLEAGAFPTSYVPSVQTFTGRTSTATFVGSNGLIQTAAAGVARMNYNPTNLTLAPKLLLEAEATNLVIHSEAFDNAAWSKSNITVTANAGIAPDGTLTADRLVSSSQTAFMSVGSQNIISAKNLVYSPSCFIKANGFNFARISLSAYSGNIARVFIDLTTGETSVIEGGSSLVFSSSVMAINMGNGWWRLSFGCIPNTTSSATGLQLTINIAESLTSADVSGDGTSGILLWGAQLEVGSSPTSYIPTTTTAITRSADTSTSATGARAADLAQVQGSNFSSWYNPEQGSLYCHAKVESRPAADARIIADISAGGPQGTGVYVSIRQTAITMDTSAAPVSINTGVANTTWFDIKAAGAIQFNNSRISVNGVLGDLDTSCNMPSQPNMLRIGRVGFTDHFFLSGHIRKLTYYPLRLPDAQLQALTSN